MLTPRIRNRDWTEPFVTPQVEYRIRSYSKHAIGGPERARIDVAGTAEELWRLLDLLRCPLDIVHHEYAEVWWGFIGRISISIGAITIGISIDSLFNKVTVTYTAPILGYGSSRQETGWATDATSAGKYGTREKRLSISDITTAMAEAIRARTLAELAEPTKEIKLERSQAPKASLECFGWWSTLGWRYNAQPNGLEAYLSGSASLRHKIGMGFTATTVGFTAGRRSIHHLGGSMSQFDRGDKLVVTGSASNNGTYTVEQGTSRVPASYTASTIRFAVDVSNSRIEDSAKGLGVFSVGQVVTLSGSGAGNNGAYTIAGAGSDGSYLEFVTALADEGPGVALTLTRGATVYTASTMEVVSGAHPKIYDTARGLGSFDAGDMIYITGSASNNGWFRVESGAADGEWLEVDRTLVVTAAGASVTVQRGNSVEVEETLVNEYPGASVTLAAYGEALAQVVTPEDTTAAWKLWKVSLRARKVGSPVDDFRVAFFNSGVGGAVGALIEYVDVAGATLSDDLGWFDVEFTLTSSVAYGSSYQVIASRTGAKSATDYYEVEINEDVLAPGTARVFVNGVWSWRDPAAAMYFALVGGEENVQQVVLSLDEYGEFIAGVTALTTSGLNSGLYRSGDRTVLADVQQLLDAGTSDNRRLLATVTKERYVTINAEPLPTSPSTIDTEGFLRDPWDTPLPKSTCPVGFWLTARDIIPALTQDENSPFPVFVERAEYNVDSDELTVEPRNKPSPWEQPAITQG